VEDITAEVQRRSEAEAIDTERRRIAREIHDGVAQSLGVLRLKSALWSDLDAASPPMRAALAEMQLILAAAIADLRRAIFALRPADLEGLGFFPALARLVDDFGEDQQLVARLEVAGEPEALPETYELPLFRVLQEGLNNARRHAHATSVLVRLEVDVAGGVWMTLRDDGEGFEPGLANPAGEHFGLRQMRERVVELGGTLDIDTGPGLGTVLFVRLPHAAPAADLATQWADVLGAR
jgi:signal transduction histidine kinase